MTEVYFADTTPLADEKMLRSVLYRLSPSRRTHAEKLNAKAARRASAGASFLLSLALSKRGIDERTVTYKENEYGKPFFVGYENLFFSLSHSGQWVMCALSEGAPVGCDIEQIKSGKELIARRFFTSEECLIIEQSQNPDMAFTRIWTQKESYAKFLGIGLAPLLSAAKAKGEKPQSDKLTPFFAKSSEVFFAEYAPAEGYLAALCAKQRPLLPPVFLDFSEMI